MAKLIKNRITFESGGYRFDFEFRYGITVVFGDSGSGKSLFYRKLSSLVLAKGFTDYRLLNYKSLLTSSILNTLTENGKVIVIDNADIVLKDIVDVQNLLRESSSQFIIMGRRTDWYNAHSYNCANVIEENKEYKLLYLFDTNK